jgi:hypothetical protein
MENAVNLNNWIFVVKVDALDIDITSSQIEYAIEEFYLEICKL